jgi:hypothetical protein
MTTLDTKRLRRELADATDALGRWRALSQTGTMTPAQVNMMIGEAVNVAHFAAVLLLDLTARKAE